MLIHKKLIFLRAHKPKHDDPIIGYTVTKRPVRIYGKNFESKEKRDSKKSKEKETTPTFLPYCNPYAAAINKCESSP